MYNKTTLLLLHRHSPEKALLFSTAPSDPIDLSRVLVRCDAVCVNRGSW